MLMSIAVGSSKIDITPSMPVYLCGYDLPIRRQNLSQGSLYPLHARALYISGPREAVLFVILDLLGVTAACVSYLKDAIERAHGVSQERIVISTIHTHSAPMLGVTAPGGVQPEGFLAEMYERILTAVDTAVRSRRPARMGYGFAVADACHNRRHVMDDGSIVDEWSEEVRRHGLIPTGPRDPFVRMLKIDEVDGAPICVVVNYSCHPVVLTKNNLLMSADYVGYSLRHIEDGTEYPIAIHTTGAAGDINPSRRADDISVARDIGETIGRAAVGAVRSIETTDVGVLRVETERFEFRSVRDGEIGHGVVRLIKLGEVVVCTIPGELVTELGARVRQIVRPCSRKAIIVSYSDAYLGYFVSDRIASEGAYEASRSAGEDAAHRLLAAVERAARRL
jgi:hypothetical protein